VIRSRKMTESMTALRTASSTEAMRGSTQREAGNRDARGDPQAGARRRRVRRHYLLLLVLLLGTREIR